MAGSKQSVSDAERTREELRARPLGQQPRESECTAEAARYFHDEGWNAAIAALAPAQEPAGGATPTPQAESLAAGRNEPAPGTTLRFGMGAFIVNTGAHAGEPAVFVDAAQEPGAVGEAAPTIPAGTTPLLRLLFPTKEQAQLVADALVNVTAAGAAPEGQS